MEIKLSKRLKVDGISHQVGFNRLALVTFLYEQVKIKKMSPEF